MELRVTVIVCEMIGGDGVFYYYYHYVLMR